MTHGRNDSVCMIFLENNLLAESNINIDYLDSKIGLKIVTNEYVPNFPMPDT